MAISLPDIHSPNLQCGLTWSSVVGIHRKLRPDGNSPVLHCECVQTTSSHTLVILPTTGASRPHTAGNPNYATLQKRAKCSAWHTTHQPPLQAASDCPLRLAWFRVKAKRNGACPAIELARCVCARCNMGGLAIGFLAPEGRHGRAVSFGWGHGNHEDQRTPMLVEVGEGGVGVVAEVAAGCLSSVLLGQSGEAVLRPHC